MSPLLKNSPTKTKSTRYLQSIHFDTQSCSILEKIKTKAKLNLRTVPESHAHLQTMAETPVQFQKDRRE